MGRLLERPKDAHTAHLIDTLLAACKNVYCIFCCMMIYEKHSASSKSLIFESLAKKCLSQEERNRLKEKVDALQGDLEQVMEELLCPKKVAKHLGELTRAIATRQEELRYDTVDTYYIF